MAIIGQYMVVKMDGTVIAGTRSEELQNECEMIEIASPSQGPAREYVAGRTNWQVSVGWLLSEVSDIQEVLTVGETYTLTFYDNVNNTLCLMGTAILKKCQITATVGNLIQGSFQFQGTGALT